MQLSILSKKQKKTFALVFGPNEHLFNWFSQYFKLGIFCIFKDLPLVDGFILYRVIALPILCVCCLNTLLQNKNTSVQEENN